MYYSRTGLRKATKPATRLAGRNALRSQIATGQPGWKSHAARGPGALARGVGARALRRAHVTVARARLVTVVRVMTRAICASVTVSRAAQPLN